ncbi:hypothetical protein HCU64_09835 [Methylobacterium sp. C25]|uniref:hypothetical protein n=1 Tax=Methylobacterium sp. C25 TaxID=2721622 RepID=UPI001F1DD983|nr:hypothetical protein [Methylobacterium sp. C25]MCE4224051.1 hypothetical protein [Methylobacterium sp. C25]
MRGVICKIPRARCERYLADGLSLSEIARREDLCQQTVSKHVRGLGLTLPSRAIVTLDDIMSVVAGRETVRDVRERLGVSRAAVHQRAAREGLRLRNLRPARWGRQLDLFRETA